MHGQQNDKYTEMRGQQNDKYTEMHGQQNDKYTEMHGQQNDKYTEMHGQQNIEKTCTVSLLWNVLFISAAEEHQQVSAVNVLNVLYSYQTVTAAWQFWHSCMREFQHIYAWMSVYLCVNVSKFMCECQ